MLQIIPDVNLGILIIAILEFAKIYIEDFIEPKVLPALAVILGGILGYFMLGGNVLAGIVTGLSASGLYKVATKLSDKIGGSPPIP